jgi:hypothetical protein
MTTLSQTNQIEFWLSAFTELANKFREEKDYTLSQYWTGQVMGICKMADLFESGIDTKYYLQKLP